MFGNSHFVIPNFMFDIVPCLEQRVSVRCKFRKFCVLTLSSDTCTLTDCLFLMVTAGMYHVKGPGLCHVLKCKRVMTTDYEQLKAESNTYVPCVVSIQYAVSSMVLV